MLLPNKLLICKIITKTNWTVVDKDLPVKLEIRRYKENNPKYQD